MPNEIWKHVAFLPEGIVTADSSEELSEKLKIIFNQPDWRHDETKNSKKMDQEKQTSTNS